VVSISGYNSNSIYLGDPNPVTVNLPVPSQDLGTISGVVFDDLNGDGMQENGEPGLGQMALNVTDPSGNPVGSTTTDQNGNYSFLNLPLGELLTVADGNYSMSVSISDTNTVTVNFPITPTLDVPAGLVVTSVRSSAVELSWNATSGATGYTVLREAPGQSTFIAVATTPVPALDDFNLSAQSTYQYEVIATDDSGDVSPLGGPVSATTPPATPSEPTNLVFSSITGTQLSLTWSAPTGTVKFV
jgi:hypothetical protein